MRNGYLVPVRVAQALFRGKLLGALRTSLHSEGLALPPDLSRSQVLSLFNKLGRKRWNVHVRARYAHGLGVLTYLARYVRGGPLSDRRIVSAADDTVRFRYTDHRDGKSKVMPLPRDEFLSRIFEHVPEPGVHAVRSYGLYAASNRALLDECRRLLGQAPAESPEYLTAEVYLERVGCAQRTRCSVCGRRLYQVPLLAASGLPPPPQERYHHVA